MADITFIKDKYSIKAGSSKDIPQILYFRKLLFQEMGVADNLLIDNVGETLLDLYTQEFKADRIRHFIAYDNNDTPVAVVGGLLKNDFPYYLFKPGFYGWIIDVYTVPEQRGQGLAGKLLELTTEWIKTKGAQEMKLIAAGKDARRLYERHGFRPTWEMSANLTGIKTYNEIIDQR